DLGRHFNADHFASLLRQQWMDEPVTAADVQHPGRRHAVAPQDARERIGLGARIEIQPLAGERQHVLDSIPVAVFAGIEIHMYPCGQPAAVQATDWESAAAASSTGRAMVGCGY